MTSPTPNPELILARIAKWRRNTALYRILNIIIFNMTKIGVPILSAIISTNLSMDINGEPFLSTFTLVVLSIAATVLSGVDAMINPADKKRMAFFTNNRLAHLEERLRINLSKITETQPLIKELNAASAELKEILDKYSHEGW